MRFALQRATLVVSIAAAAALGAVTGATTGELRGAAHLTATVATERVRWSSAVPRVPLRRAGNVIPKAELRDIYSISCLKAKQQDPSFPCTGDDHVPPEAVRLAARQDELPQASVGSYPVWQSSHCHSRGAYFCDPNLQLKAKEQEALNLELRNLTTTASVTCGQLETKLSGEKQVFTRPFYLGLAIVGEWPEMQSDQATLQKFGDVVMAQWGLMPTYNGVRVAAGSASSQPCGAAGSCNCPNSALLIVLADRGQAFLSSPSCEFLCDRRGGPEVAAAFETALQAGSGLPAAISAAIAEVHTLLSQTWPMSIEEPASTRDRRTGYEYRRWQARFWRSDYTWVLLQRAALLSLVVVAVAFAFGILAMVVAPNKPMLRKAG